MKKRKLFKKVSMLAAAATLTALVGVNAYAVPVEKVIIYENFGGEAADGMTAEKWPEFHGDSLADKDGNNQWNAADGYTVGVLKSGWRRRTEKITNTVDYNATRLDLPFPQTSDGAPAFHYDTIAKYRTTPLSSEIINRGFGRWEKTIDLRNGGKELSGGSSIGIGLTNVGCFPNFYSTISYDTLVAPWHRGPFNPGTKGYLITGTHGQVGFDASISPTVVFPAADESLLPNVSKLEVLFSGSRNGVNNNTLVVRVAKFNGDMESTGIDTFTFNSNYYTRLVSVPVSAPYVRFYLEGLGATNNANVLDFSTRDNHTEVDATKGGTKYNMNAFNVKGNPNVLIYKIKVYGLVEGTGYSTTLNGGVTANPNLTSGIEHGQRVQYTAPATNGDGKVFVGWKISGREDLSEVANPLTLEVKEDLTITPVYGGDNVEVAVVNENFTNWVQHGKLVANAAQAARGFLQYIPNPNATQITDNEIVDKVVTVPLRYGFTNGATNTSIDITLSKCNVMPRSTTRVYNIPGADKWMGFVAFMGPNGVNKGYVEVAEVQGATKAVVEVSNYDLVNFATSNCAIEVNGAVVRNLPMRSLAPEKLELPLTDAATTLRVGGGNQLQMEYFWKTDGSADPTWSNIKGANARAMALHTLKVYANVAAPNKPHHKLSVVKEGDGKVFFAPSIPNSDTMYLEGSQVSLLATPASGFGFDGWYDGATRLSDKDTITVTVDAAKVVKARFAQNPSYITLTVANPDKGSVAFSVEPQAVDSVNNKYTFLAGVPVTLTATPVYMFKASMDKWAVTDDKGTKAQVGLNTSLVFAAADMVKEGEISVGFTFDTITATKTFTVLSDTVLGKVTFDLEPLSVEYPTADSAVFTFPEGATVAMSTESKYPNGPDNIFNELKGEAFWSRGSEVVSASAQTVSNIIMTAEQKVRITWRKLTYRLLVVNQGNNGTIELDDPNMDYSDLERGNGVDTFRFPQDYWVRFKSLPDDKFILGSIEGGASYLIEGENSETLTISMGTDTVVITAEFIPKQEGVSKLIDENFQNATRWIQNPATLGNVPSAISYLGLDANWTPIGKPYNDILKVLAPYRELASLNGSAYPEGPSAAKMQAGLVLQYDIRKEVNLPVGTSNIKVTLGNYAPCNNCLIHKAVKGENIGKRYLGQVSPGMVAINSNKTKSAMGVDAQPFMDGDTTGVMIIDGMAYVEKLEVDYCPSTSNHCPAVYYNIDGSASIDEQGRFHGDISSWTLTLGSQLARKTDRPDMGAYGWGCSQEGMTMDQNMFVGEQGVEQTQIVIFPAYEKTKENEQDVYKYHAVYLHGLRVWGSMRKLDETGISNLFSRENSNSVFYMLGSTNVLKVDVQEPIKSIVLYNEMGACIGVFRGLAEDNRLIINGLKRGVYGVHAYTVDGKQYTGSFLKLND